MVVHNIPIRSSWAPKSLVALAAHQALLTIDISSLSPPSRTKQSYKIIVGRILLESITMTDKDSTNPQSHEELGNMIERNSPSTDHVAASPSTPTQPMHTHIHLHSNPRSPTLGPWMSPISPAAERRSARYLAVHDKLSLQLDRVEAESSDPRAVHSEAPMNDTPHTHTRGFAIRLPPSDVSPSVSKARSRRVNEFDEGSSTEDRSTKVSEEPPRINTGGSRTSKDAEHTTRPPLRLRKRKLSLAYQIEHDKEAYGPPGQSDGSGD